MAALPHAIDDERAQRADAAVGRLALSKCEAADALGVSVDYLEEHVMHELRVVRRPVLAASRLASLDQEIK